MQRKKPISQYFIISDFDIQLFDDEPEDEYEDFIGQMKKNSENIYFQLQQDKSLTWHTIGDEVSLNPDKDGYYNAEVSPFRLNNSNSNKPQLIFDKSSACIRECAITLTLKPVTEDGNEIQKIKATSTLLTTQRNLERLAQIDAIARYPLKDFNGKQVDIGWSEISPHILKLNFQDTLTEIQPDNDDNIKMYLSWLDLPYQSENIQAYHYKSRRPFNGAVIVIKNSDPVTDLKMLVKKMDATIFDGGNGAIFHSDTMSLTGLYYYYDTVSRILYLAILPSNYNGVTEYFTQDYMVIRTLNPDNIGVLAQESDLILNKDEFERKFNSPLHSYIDKEKLTSAVTERINNAIASPDFFFRYPEKNSIKSNWIDLSYLSDFFRVSSMQLSARLYKSTVEELQNNLKEEYPQGRAYLDFFINDSPPVFYFLGKTNTELTLQYTFKSKNIANNDLMMQVIITQLLRQISPLQLNPINPVRMSHFLKYKINKDDVWGGYDTTENEEFISFNGLLLRSDTGEVIIRNSPENHTVYTTESGLIQARDANLKHESDKLKLYTKKGEFLVSGERFEFNKAENTVIVSRCCGTGVFDLNTRKWLIEPKLALISNYNGFYIARVHFRQPTTEIIFNHQGGVIGYGRSIITSKRSRQILIFDNTIDSGRWVNDDGTASEQPVVTEKIMLPQGVLYMISIEDRIMLINEQTDVIIPASDYSKYKKEKNSLWLWSVRENKWLEIDVGLKLKSIYR
ncbi:hypothetical protein [Hafnia alvei]|uniref:Uncharacterized protein n=1 Tax=Hafnia alvei TaxID=569 RepID=A0A1C6YXV1_HAFAL|nr:hypothetical protein [Hafnia alvei]SCM51684.1 hypothetical protein BN1044_01152 [Hafnia alvei]